MIKLYVITKTFDERGLEFYRHYEIHYKRPRRYMCGWNFEQMMKYAKSEIEWLDIDDNEEIVGFELTNKDEYWTQSIYKGE